ncbi:hypothetical protein F183_A10340 [Bryobacterales bacterium F-183]|nr:hypothetical protein F183_A10340 [Bryobacterales bacterium F-183]
MAFVDDALQILGNIADNQKNLRELELQRSSIVPFVGAGLSIPFGYPNWKDLLLGLAPNDAVRGEVRTFVDSSLFEEAAERVARKVAPDTFAEAIREAFKRRPLEPNTEAVFELARMAPNLVLTTNLDTVLEDVFESAGKKFQWLLKGNDLHEASGAMQQGKSMLLKLHGNVEGNEDDWILTRAQYQRAYGDPDQPNPDLALPKLLEAAIVSKTILFLGCSLETDRTVRVLRAAVKGRGLKHFALLQEPADLGARLKQLQQWNVLPLFFRRKDYASIAKFLACLAAQGGPDVAPGAAVSIDVLVRNARAAVSQSISTRCGTMKVVYRTQPVEADAIYTDVEIMEKLSEDAICDLDELQKKARSAPFERFGLPRALERAEGLATAAKHKRLMIYGAPGAGKTTFLYRLAMQCRRGEFQPGCVPVFCPLLELSKSKLTIEQWVANEHPNVDWAPLLAEGRVLFLLDGLDETEADRFDAIRRDVERLARNTSCPILMTCRVVAKDYRFPNFVDVEMADFNTTQIRVFVNRWFRRNAMQHMADAFLSKLASNPKLAELATKPLLLTLLCLIFEDRGDLDGSRASLYKAGLEVMLRKWDNLRAIEGRFALSVDVLEQTLEEIAFTRFEKHEYFFEAEDLRKQANTLLSAKGIDVHKEDFLRIAAAGVGLLAPRAKDIYSFSHLTFQEYLSARRVIANPALLSEMGTVIGDSRWREVWLLLANLTDGDYLIPRMHRMVDPTLNNNQRVTELLRWCAVQVSTGIPVFQKVPARRRYLMWAVVTLARGRALDPDLARTLDRALFSAGALADSRDLVRDRILAAVIARDGEHVMTQAIARARALNLQDADCLNKYLTANLHLVQCMKESRGLSQATRHEIEESILLPPTLD